MKGQTEIQVPPPPPVDLDRLRAALAFWGLTGDPRRLAKHPDEGRWEFEVAVPGMPPVRAAGRTRDECLRAALVEALAALRTHEGDLRRRLELLSDQAADVGRFLAGCPNG